MTIYLIMKKTAIHRRNYFEWPGLERRLNLHSGVDIRMEKGMSSQIKTWREILKRIIDIVFFLGVRGLAFRGHSQKNGSSDNGNFLGIFELLSLMILFYGSMQELSQIHRQAENVCLHTICLLTPKMNLFQHVPITLGWSKKNTFVLDPFE